MLILSGLIAAFSALGSTGCVYRLAPPMPPFQQRLRIIANAPERYTVRVQSSDYAVPADGRVVFNMGMTHRACSVYLFDRIPIRRVPSPTKEKSISIMLGASPVQRLSIHDIATLPTDSDGVPQFDVATIGPGGGRSLR